MKNKKLLLLIPILLAGLYFLLNRQEKVLAGYSSGVTSIAGSRTGTTTVAQEFYSTPDVNGTTSIATFVGGAMDTALVTFKIFNASSTPDGFINWDISGSNDGTCNTATTSTIASNQVVKKDINWYSISQGTIRATSAATGTSQTLTNLNWDCLQVNVNGSSTEAFVQLKTKEN